MIIPQYDTGRRQLEGDRRKRRRREEKRWSGGEEGGCEGNEEKKKAGDKEGEGVRCEEAGGEEREGAREFNEA